MRCFSRVAGVAGLLGLVALVGGCATPSLPATQAVQRVAVERFELMGRLAASHGEQAVSVTLNWRHFPGGDDLSFVGPLGQILGQLRVSPEGAVLVGADGRALRAASGEDLLEKTLGLRLPLGQVAHWVQGVVSPPARIRRLDSQGRPASVADQGWIVDYLDYGGLDPLARPRRLEAAWGEARIKLVIDQWNPDL